MLSRAARVARLQTPLLRAIARPAPRSQLAVAPWRRTYAKVNKPESPDPKKATDSSEPNYDGDVAARAAKEAADAEKANTVGDKAAAEEELSEAEKANYPLPDLTQGIPSTLEYEMSGATTSKSALQAISEDEAFSGGGKGKGLGRNWDDKIDEERHPDVPNGWGLGLWWNRASTRMSEFTNYYQEPAFEKLLPDVDPSFERPYTLCISLEDMLVHSEWSREHGWRVAKRPGVDYFLRYLSQYYELVLFTSVPFAIGEPLVRKLDPFRFIMWPLYREATKYNDGEIVKDLSYLNRDLSKVIIIDSKASHVRNQPENAIVLDKWTGDSKDKDLVGLIPFLEYIHTMQYGDVRKVLKSFEGKHIPTEFARREAIARAEFEKQLAAKGKKTPSGMGMLGGMLGLKPSNMALMQSPDGELSPAEAFAQGKMLQDIARERGQRNYELLEKEIRENGAKWLKEEAEMQEKAQQEALNSMMGSFSGWFVPSKTEENPADGKKA
ncbi:hypothetical protein BN1708_013187 [Verticillium longisporum]|uniref:Mitochondrial import inner membrane translocase subunit TIM50 n=1 Tax=Verticillium longisporum TaxID=100787 RepID=A0A0G4LI57_VERLO|nr:hypothetical protein BN1708_013187 [Verticillium longisporum]